MARIRSVHPGLFTDEGFMGLSAMSRVLLVGLWVEADDQGVFEWKPLTLKARLLPADVVDMAAMLSELVAARFIQPFTEGGKAYGAVRNFRKYQRPKKPNAVYPLPQEWRTFVGLSGDGSVPVTHQEPTSGENPPQMEDGGGRVEDEREESVEAAASDGTAIETRTIVINEERRKAARLPDDWVLPAEWVGWAQTRRPEVDPYLEGEKFANFWQAKSGRDAAKLDWKATWRNWILNAKASGNAQRPNDPVSFTEIAARVAARKTAAGL